MKAGLAYCNPEYLNWVLVETVGTVTVQNSFGLITYRIDLRQCPTTGRVVQCLWPIAGKVSAPTEVSNDNE